MTSNEDYNGDSMDYEEQMDGRSIDVTTMQAAHMLGVTRRSIARYIESGKLPARKKNLRDLIINLDDLRRFATENSITLDESKMKLQ